MTGTVINLFYYLLTAPLIHSDLDWKITLKGISSSLNIYQPYYRGFGLILLYSERIHKKTILHNMLPEVRISHFCCIIVLGLACNDNCVLR